MQDAEKVATRDISPLPHPQGWINEAEWRLETDKWKYFSTHHIIILLNSLPQDVAVPTNLASFKRRCSHMTVFYSPMLERICPWVWGAGILSGNRAVVLRSRLRDSHKSHWEQDTGLDVPLDWSSRALRMWKDHLWLLQEQVSPSLSGSFPPGREEGR